jgi:LmbE family N-acetylglucosaminyl deacetylase
MESVLVLVVSDNLEAAAEIKASLPSQTLVSRRSEATRSVLAVKPDVVVMGPGDLELVVAVRDAQPGTPVIVMADDDTSHDDALAFGASAFLVGDEELAEHVARLGQAFRESKAAAGEPQVVLAIGAHPDDVEVGVGGILATHRAAGDSVTILTLPIGHRPCGAAVARAEGAASAAVIGAELRAGDSTEESFLDLDQIQRAIAELQPTIVYTHSKNDLRQEHRLVHEVTVAETTSVRSVYCYQGTTGAIEFAPSRFVAIDDFVEVKLAMLAKFAANTERPGYLEPEFVLSTGRYWSQYGHGLRCEPLEVLRENEVVVPSDLATASAS